MGESKYCFALQREASVEERPFMAAQHALSPVFLSDSEGANATEEESKDPENMSFAMPFQGVLTTM